MPNMPFQVPLIVAVVIAVLKDRADLIAENIAPAACEKLLRPSAT